MINSSTFVCSPLFENGVGWGNDTVIQTINPTGLFHFISSFNKITNNNNDININKHMQRRRRVNNSNNNNNFFFFQKASVALITKLPNLPSICFPFLSISYHIITYHITTRYVSYYSMMCLCSTRLAIKILPGQRVARWLQIRIFWTICGVKFLYIREATHT